MNLELAVQLGICAGTIVGVSLLAHAFNKSNIRAMKEMEAKRAARRTPPLTEPLVDTRKIFPGKSGPQDIGVKADSVRERVTDIQVRRPLIREPDNSTARITRAQEAELERRRRENDNDQNFLATVAAVALMDVEPARSSPSSSNCGGSSWGGGSSSSSSDNSSSSSSSDSGGSSCD